jgi:hypothetical protein
VGGLEQGLSMTGHARSRWCLLLLHAAGVMLLLAQPGCGDDAGPEPEPGTSSDAGGPHFQPGAKFSHCNSALNPDASAVPAFSTPVWSATAEWEAAGYLQGSGAPGDLDGPIEDLVVRDLDGIQSTNAPKYESPEVTSLFYDSFLGRAHTVAGSARGYLDGPFSRARFLGADRCRPHRGSRIRTRDGRYIFFTEPRAKQALRQIDFVEQEVTTLLRDGSPTLGLAASDSELYVVSKDNKLTVMDLDGKPKRDVTLQLPDAADGKPAVIGGWGCKLLLDEPRRIVYGVRSHNSTIPFSAWYWNIDTGAFTPLIPLHKEADAPRTGPLDNIGWYPDIWGLHFGPDDPDRKQIYVHVDHMNGAYRIDLIEKKVWSMTLDKDKNRIVWVTDGVNPKGWNPGSHSPRWLGSTGDFYLPNAGRRGPNLLYKRVK